MNIFGVSAKKEQALQEKLARFGIMENELEEHFIRSRGPGGQNVNKVSTGVYIKHIPTGVEVKVFSERSQALNRYAARKILVNKIETMVLGRESEERREREKIRRQKRKRSKRAKEKMLKMKRIRSERKEMRRKVEANNV